ncbi:MAG TPA: hypothetical protein VK543_02425 [Puia sp.]|nr:hypothetical protein [Puia sp.]
MLSNSLNSSVLLYRAYTKERLDYFVFLIFFFYGTGINAFTNTDISLVIMSVLGLAYIYIAKKESIDRIFIYVVCYWLIVNFFSWVFLGAEHFSIFKLGGSMLKLFIGYAFMKIYKEKFILWYEQIVFFLALVSLLFFAVQLIDNNIFAKIPFNLIDKERGIEGHWYGIIFHYSSWHPSQNAGFAGEPGGFGYYIGLAMIFNLILNRGKITWRFLIFLLVGLTTLSTNFYLTIILFGFYFVYKSSLFVKLISIALLVPLAILLFQLPFVGEKINDYFNETKQFSESSIIKRTRVNRTSMFVNDARDVSKYPLGRGINETGLRTNIYGENIEGTNDFSKIAVRYGILGMIYFLVIYFRMFDKISLGLKGNFIFAMIMCMYIAANSLERDYFAMGLFWLYFIVHDEEIIRLLRFKSNGGKGHTFAEG